MVKTLYIMCGIPGSGKSWYAKNILMNEHTVYISRDEVRFAMLKDSDDYFDKEDQVFCSFVNQINYALGAEDNIDAVIADATHLNWPSRRKLLNALTHRNIKIIPVWMNTPFSTCKTWNEQRGGRAVVPVSVLNRMEHSKEHPIADPCEYDGILEVENQMDLSIIPAEEGINIQKEFLQNWHEEDET